MRLIDKVAIVTGSGRGIGQAVALAFAAEGAKVVIAEFEEEVGKETLEKIKVAGGNGMIIPVDVSQKAQTEAMAQNTLDRYGKIDILVNCAGNSKTAMLHNLTEADWDAVISVHLKGTFNCIQAVAENMMARKAGKIINLTSAAGLTGTMGQINYSAAKAGITGVTKSAAKELARYNICVNAISPLADTRMTHTVLYDPKFREKSLARVPMGRFALPEEIAPSFVFFASDDANYITGQVLCVDGGLVM